jgi:hypothetical protein
MNQSALISCVLAVTALLPAWAQTPESDNLRIILLEGEGSINNIQAKNSRDLAVRLEDAQNGPIAGATITFSLPSRGASGTFPNGNTVVTVTTDAQGRAGVHGLKPNQVAGKVEIRVNASYQGKTAAATITQFNMLVPGQSDQAKVTSSGRRGSNKTLVLILAIAGAAAAGGAVAAMHKGGSSSPGSPASGGTTPGIPTITITPGAGTVGPPQ